MDNNRLTVAISNDFFKSLNNIPEKSRSKVAAFISKFRNNPRSSSLNYERIEGGKDKFIRSLRVDQDIRCILRSPEKGNTFILLWVDRHDDAYKWAKRRTCHVNRVSGALQVVDVVSAESSLIQNEDSSIEAISKTAFDNSSKSLFENCDDEDLMLIGIPEVLIPSVRAVKDYDDLSRLIEWLPKSSVDSLILLSENKTIEEVIEELDHKKISSVDTKDLSKALDFDESRAEFLVITDDDVLEAMLSAPMEQWRVFLHPSQRRLIERDWNGPVRVLGGAGTGKTVVAMHKAKWLAKKIIEEKKIEKILFTTFTQNLAIDIKNNLTKICSPEELQCIEVTNLDSWVMSYLRGQDLPIRIFDESARKSAWDIAMSLSETSLGLHERFYQEEWKEVILANGCQSLSEYLHVRRIGRGTSLNRKKRALIWPVFDALRREFRQRGLWEPEDAKQAASALINESKEKFNYSSIIIDECQDFDEPSFKLLKTLIGESHLNDMFIVGDPHQRIYGKPIILSHCGIEVRGRSKKLRINYRTTEETRSWATLVLKNIDFDDLDGGKDFLNEYRSLLHGDYPLIKGFDDPAEEEIFLVKTFRKILLEQGDLSGTCVVCRTNKTVSKLQNTLINEGIPSRIITKEAWDDQSDKSIRIATMHRVKGLEFDQIFIPFLDFNQMPYRYELNNKPDEVSKIQFEKQERSLLHVAATRAKKRVVITFSGAPSEFLKLD